MGPALVTLIAIDILVEKSSVILDFLFTARVKSHVFVYHQVERTNLFIFYTGC